MDYEQKYKQVLEKAKIWQEHLDEIGDRDYADELNYIFPELIESEDEKIRKAIIAYIDHGQHNGVSNKDMIAWLEKQSEKNVNHIGIKEKAHQIAWETSKDYDPLLSKESWCEMAALDMASWLEKQGDINETSAEWSEEDKQMILSIEQVMNCASLLNLVPEKIDNIKSWLKSLRPQKQWKPSTAQLIIIKDLIEDKNTSKVNKVILRGMLDEFKQFINSQSSQFSSKHLLDSDKVIEWLECKAFQGWREPIDIRPIIRKFKKDFEL